MKTGKSAALFFAILLATALSACATAPAKPVAAPSQPDNYGPQGNAFLAWCQDYQGQAKVLAGELKSSPTAWPAKQSIAATRAAEDDPRAQEDEEGGGKEG